MTNSLISGLSSSVANPAAPSTRDPMQAQRETRLKEAKAALETMRQRSSSAADERKAAARKKVEDLKARIQMLKMTMPSDPKAAARMVAQLARELGAAVKAYGGSGGAMTDLASSASAGPPVAEASVAEGQAGAQAEASADIVVPKDAPDDVGEEEGVSAKAADPDAKATPTDPYRKAIEAQQTQAADQARKAEGVRADSEFVTTVKGLTADLKAMAKKAEADARRSGENGSEADAAKAALDAVDSQVDDLAGGLTGGMVSLLV
jgi:hypothetical protein